MKQQMKNRIGNRSGYGIVIWFLCVLFAVISFTKTALYATKVYYWISLLPATFLIVTIFCITIFSKILHNFVFAALYFGYMIRLVFAPFFFCLGDCQSFFQRGISGTAMMSGCILMAGEFLIYLFVCLLWFRKNPKRLLQKATVDIDGFGSNAVVKILIPLTLFLLITYLLIPSLQTVYWPLFRASLSKVALIYYDNDTIVARGGIQRYLYSLFCFIWPITRVMLPSLLIVQIFRRKGYFLMVELSLIIPFAFLGGDNLAPIFCSIITLLIIARLYPEHFRRLLITVVFLGGIFLAFVVPTKYHSMQIVRGGAFFSTLSQMLQAYFPGFDNVALVAEIPKIKYFQTLFADFYYGIPFKETLFGLNIVNLQERFTAMTGIGGQILPFDAQLNYYLPMPLVWCMIGALIWLTAYYYDKARKTGNFWKVFEYTYFSVYTSISLSIYSFSIYIRGLLNILLPVVLIVWVVGATKRKRVKKHHVKI